jgi:MFS family permease
MTVYLAGFLWISYSVTSPVVESYFGVSATLTNMLSMIYMFVYLPGVPVATYIADKFGLRVAVLSGAAFNCVGSAVRAGGSFPSLFWLTMIGQVERLMYRCFCLTTESRLWLQLVSAFYLEHQHY